MEYVIEMLNIRKEFPGIVANDNITLQLRQGEIHALLGENGAGKSTLMSVLFGLYKPEKGSIKVRGEEVNITNPNVATALGIGMVHQHFKLVEKFSVTENIILGAEPRGSFGRVNINEARTKIIELSERYNLNVDPDAKISDISVGMQQRVEILKMLYRDAEILIFDEPTAVLTPQEIGELLLIMENLTTLGKSIILITHKLREIKSVADRCTVIRKGRYVGMVDVATTSEQEMANLMVGRDVNFNLEKTEAKPAETIVRFENVSYKDKEGVVRLKDVSFEAKAGEILGIAGVEGNGQSEIINCLSGLTMPTDGKITLGSTDITKSSIRNRITEGLGHIPEDRHKHGLVLDFTIAENMVLQTFRDAPYSNRIGILDYSSMLSQTNEIIEKYDVRSGQGAKSIARGLSGGNQQKAIIGREISRQPQALIAAQPTRGLDVGAIENIHECLLNERDKGRAVLLISLELDEILSVADRIIVMHNGRISGEVLAKDTNENELGLMMAGGGAH